MNILTATKNRNRFYALTLAMIMIIMTFMPMQAFAWSFTDNPVDTGIVSMYFGDPDYDPVPPESLMIFDQTGTLTYDAVYTGINSATYYPNRLLLVIRPEIPAATITISNEDETDLTATEVDDGVYDIVLDDAVQPVFEFEATDGTTTQIITITFHQPKEDTTAGTGVYAFLPAPGQFTNENMASGGWGTIYNSVGTFKNMMNNTVATGISLGYFGGYVVFDMGLDGSGQGNVKNDPNHPGGYDFKVVGNPFSGWSEPGGI